MSEVPSGRRGGILDDWVAFGAILKYWGCLN
jgi:hypothetical protein